MMPSSPLTRREALRSFGLLGASALFGPALIRAAADAAPAQKATVVTPSLAGAQPGFYRFVIGAFEALALNDGSTVFPIRAAWPAASAESVGAVLKAAALNPAEVRLPFNVLLVKIGSELVLIDTGCGKLYGPAGGRLIGNLAAAGVKPEQITAVILTHAHGDHHGGLVDPETRSLTFKNARHFVHRREYDFWTNEPDLSTELIDAQMRQGFINGSQTALRALEGRWDFIRPGDKLLDGLEIIDAPGHTPGHIALLFSSGSEQLLHFVDTVHHHEVSFGRPDAAFFGDVQPAVAVATRKRILDRSAADGLRVFGAHMPFPSLGRVRSEKGRYEFRIEPWVV